MPPYKKQINALYALCTRLRFSFNEIDSKVEMTLEIAMNAAVTAGRLGSHLRACTETAQQINGTAKRMRQYTDALRAEVNQLTNHVMTMLIIAGRMEKYEDAQMRSKDKNLDLLLQDVLAEQMMKVSQMASNLMPSIYKSLSLLGLLSLCNRRLFVALSALEIEAVNLPHNHSSIIMSLVEKLSETADQGIEKVENSKKYLHQIRKLGCYVQGASGQEVNYEKIHAA